MAKKVDTAEEVVGWCSVVCVVERLCLSCIVCQKWYTELTDKSHDFQDWGVWHFVGDLPLNDKDLVTCIVRSVDLDDAGVGSDELL